LLEAVRISFSDQQRVTGKKQLIISWIFIFTTQTALAEY